ncbi:general stress protein [Pontibacillus halophilus JSM 076056 = DSM 19796]|uniref:General stress protein n=1 Tax=Pontibacillus halophilus JSM 076056 = DSM 19796 TaxID=1385510 RepID=A0A0A5GGE5_9BACI|nr:YjzC family protein [Pontibacillus halophilus]KGX92321.1 general stress protein [Pontibacillus halophilus JSM 076056 = DSM 19796]
MAERFKTGEKAPQKGTYEFDGLTDKRKNANPTSEESQIQLDSGDTFPPLSSSNEGAYWKKK